MNRMFTAALDVLELLISESTQKWTGIRRLILCSTGLRLRRLLSLLTVPGIIEGPVCTYGDPALRRCRFLRGRRKSRLSRDLVYDSCGCTLGPTATHRIRLQIRLSSESSLIRNPHMVDNLTMTRTQKPKHDSLKD